MEIHNNSCEYTRGRRNHCTEALFCYSESNSCRRLKVFFKFLLLVFKLFLFFPVEALVENEWMQVTDLTSFVITR